MPALLSKLQKEMNAAGIAARSPAARAWLFKRIQKLRLPTNRSNILNDPTRIAAKAFIGKMYAFRYDAKYGDTLPVWDAYPLVLPINIYADGFLGLNLHYLDPYTRLMFLDKLHDFINNKKYDDTTTLRLSYDLLSSSRRYKLFEPCIKRYLFSHIDSPFIYIEPDHWETIIFIPFERWNYN